MSSGARYHLVTTCFVSCLVSGAFYERSNDTAVRQKVRPTKMTRKVTHTPVLHSRLTVILAKVPAEGRTSFPALLLSSSLDDDIMDDESTIRANPKSQI
jgi:hypothetical protein